MRKKHDQYPNWLFEDKKNKAPFTKGTIRMDKADIEKSLDLFYEVQGWDVKSGLPSANHYRSLGLNDVADTMTGITRWLASISGRLWGGSNRNPAGESG